ncbi:MAG: hypothetical protein ACK559_10940, partial [bacterium]
TVCASSGMIKRFLEYHERDMTRIMVHLSSNRVLSPGFEKCIRGLSISIFHKNFGLHAEKVSPTKKKIPLKFRQA